MKKVLASLSPKYLAMYASKGSWKLAKHLDLLNDYLCELTARRIKRLMVVMPPRHGKSLFISQYFPVWYLGNHQDDRIILSSYEADLAASWGRKVRDTIEDIGKDIFGIKLKENSQAANRWDVEGSNGGMNTAGIGGPITGKGANLLIIDDPVKNALEANSKTYRDRAWEWYTSTAYTRLEPNGVVVLIMTRWHEDDLAGRILNDKEEAKKWTVLSLPALAEENDILGRRKGEALWRERYDEEKLNEIQKTIGSYWFSSLYQGTPTPAEGKIFKRSLFRYYEEDENYYILKTDTLSKRVEKNSCSIFQTVDTAATEKETSDYFVIATWAITPDRELLLLDIFRERIDTTKHNKVIKDYYLRYKPFLVGIEEKTFGLTIIQQLKSELPIKPLKADIDKIARALVIAAKYENGLIYHPVKAHWLAEFESELLEFPNGANDDQVDCAGYAGFIMNDYTGEVYYSTRGRLRDGGEEG